MVFVGKRCVKLHRTMLMIVGLWPYQKPVIWRLQSVFFLSIYCCDLLFQFVFITNYYSFYFNSEAVKQIFEHMQLDWKMFENSDAMKIFEEYLFESYIFTLFTCILLLIAASFTTTIECRSIILDIIIPMNESRQRKIEVDFELFVNEEQYFFWYLVQEVVGVGIGFWSVLTTGTLLTTVTKHSCATYKIVSYLIQNTVTIHTLQLPVVQRIQYMRRNICLSVYIHRRTLEFCKSLLLSFDMWYFPLLLVGVWSLSCILFRLYNAIIHFNDFYDIVLSCGLLLCYLIYMLMANFLGQSYSEHSVELLDSTYDTLWYVAPLPIQKLFLMMQTSIRSHKVVMGGVFVMSIEGFSTMMTSAVSYFTVMHAMRV
ncbi:hypothetical protein X777_14131 [Ooceraea biroi]|uniref:Odorant receptor n=1 Tax=Ooceraea biroi TaxID=2015173 RepID=A0A026VZD6_OOCBI|nr:hypothetical protein X777_14131 [Ooceraea biroi]